MTQQNRKFLQETAFEEDVNLDEAPKTANPPKSTEEMRQRWAQNDKK